jgi:hypothetical protein
VVLLPLRLFPTTGYARFLKSWEVRINKIIVVSTGIVLIWILLWYIMIGLGHFMDKSLKISEAEEVAMTSLKNDSIIINRLGLLDSIELTKNSISAKTANFDYILHGKDSILHVEIVLRHNQKWILDSIIIK